MVTQIQDPNTPKFNTTTGQPTDYGASLGLTSPYANPVNIPSNINTVDASKLNGSNITTPIIPTPTYGGLPGAIESTINNAKKTQDQLNLEALKTKTDSAGADYIKAINESGDVSNVDRTDQNKYKNLSDEYTSQIESEALANRRAIESIQKNNPEGLGNVGLSSKISDINKESLSKQADLAIIQNSFARKYDTAASIADRQVQLNLEKSTAKLNALKTFYEMNKADFTKADDRAYDKKIKEEELALKKQTDLENTIKDTKISLAQSGSLTPAIAEALSKIDTTQPGAIDQIIKVVGKNMPNANAELVKVGDSLMRIDKVTGKVINNYGSGTSTSQITETPMVRTVTDVTTGKKMPVSGYTLAAGDDPYNIAVQNGVTMDALKKLNPNISDWTNLKPGSVINVPNKDLSVGSLLATTGLSYDAFQYLTVGNAALTRMSEASRAKVKAEARAFTTKRGLDEATFKTQYEAQNKNINGNILKVNAAKTAEMELAATLDNLKTAADDASFKDMRWKNIAKLFAGKEFNDENVSKYSFHLNQLRSEMAAYNAAIAGKVTNDGVVQVDQSDLNEADRIIRDGFAKGSITGFEGGLKASVSKMDSILNSRVSDTNKKVWDLFGVGEQYTSPKVKVDPMENIKSYGDKHPEARTTIINMQKDGRTIEEINNWVNQQ